MSTPALKIAQSEGCWVDGRARYFRYRHNQLVGLYNLISSNRTSFVESIREDSGKSELEATVEVAVVLRHLKATYEAIPFDALAQRVKSLKMSGTLERPAGFVAVYGHWTAPLDSVLSPLGAAIAGGSVVVSVLKLDVEAKATYELLCKLCKGAIDTTAYPILLGSASVVEQTASASFTSYHATSTDMGFRKRIQTLAAGNSASLTMLPEKLGHNVCIVSKTIPQQDLASVAEQVCRSNFGCVGGQGLSATSIVLVHEAIHDRFAQEMVKATRQLFPRSGNGWKDVAKFQATAGEYEALSQSLMGHNVICGGEYDKNFGTFAPTIVESVKPDSVLLVRSRGTPVVPLVPFTSTETAIAVAQERLGHSLYVFGTELEADYFANELRPSIVSHGAIPLDQLVGVMPSSTVTNNGIRWPISLFVRSTSIVQQHPGVDDLIMPPYGAWHIGAIYSKLLPAPRVLAVRRKRHSASVGRNFFLQGAFLSLSVIGTTVVAAGILAYHVFLR
ncbi:hypothetical protein JCM24511_09475 [Saitozyma sp. JCM 24511]|nr:hypothetical protein JCM24511_09475 [Saitozyma sp. JCM 24511]